jgi:hypothetical protein
MEGMSGGHVLSGRGVSGMVDFGGHGTIEMNGCISSYTKAKASSTILEVLKRYLIVQVQSHASHTSNRYTTLCCDLLSTY